jgi:phosphatidylglycerol:prolipoprotein diacylglycerol transferase
MNSWGFFTAAGGVTSVLWLLKHRSNIGLTQNEFWGGIWTIVIGGIVGAKILFLILGWEHYQNNELRFWADFDVGFVFFGGLIGAVAASLVFAQVKSLSFIRGADYFAVAIPLGHSIGRIGCFFTGCCGGHPPHPVQLYESFGLILIAGVCRIVLTRIERGKNSPGTAFYSYLILYAILRFLLDPLRADGRPERLLGLSFQQLISVAIIALAFLFINQHVLRKPIA